MKGLLVTLLVLAALAVGADRAAVFVAERVVADQAQATGGLAERPDVDVRGFPFLTQAVAGRYDDVRVRTSGAVGGLAQVERLEVRLRGVQVPLSDALRGDVASVPVQALDGEVLLSFAYLSQQAPDGVTLAPDGDRLRVTGTVEVLGQELSASASSEVSVDGDDVVVRARELRAGDRELPLGALAARFDFRVPVTDLPYGLELTALQVRPDGVALQARSGATVLSR